MSRLAAVQACLALLIISGAGSAAAAERFVAWGDSTTLGTLDGANLGGYPGRLQTLLVGEGRDVVVENWGLFGETTAEALSRINGLSGSAADTFILMEGANDLLQQIGRGTVKNNLVLLLDKARQRGFGKVMLATIIPMSSKVGVKSAPPEARRLNQDLRQIGYDQQIARPDAERGMHDLLPLLFQDYYADGKMHPNARGYDELAKIFLDYIQGRDTQAPQASFPIPGDADKVPPNQLLQLVLFDPLSGVDFAASTLTLNGIPIATDIAGEPKRAVLSARPGNLCGQLMLGVIAHDLASPPNERVQDQVIFSVQGCSGREGDLDLSGRVDGVDLVLLARAFGAQRGSSRYLSAADIDQNDVVDGTDLARLAAHFGEGFS